MDLHVRRAIEDETTEWDIAGRVCRRLGPSSGGRKSRVKTLKNSKFFLLDF